MFYIEFWLVLKSWNHLSFVNISPTLVIDTSMERSSRVLATAWKLKNLIFFSKKVRNIELCWRAEISYHSSRSQHALVWRHRGCIVVPLGWYLVYFLVLATHRSVGPSGPTPNKTGGRRALTSRAPRVLSPTLCLGRSPGRLHLGHSVVPRGISIDHSCVCPL